MGKEEEEKGGSSAKEKEACMDQQHAGDQKSNDTGQGVTLPISEKESSKVSNNERKEESSSASEKDRDQLLNNAKNDQKLA